MVSLLLENLTERLIDKESNVFKLFARLKNYCRSNA